MQSILEFIAEVLAPLVLEDWDQLRRITRWRLFGGWVVGVSTFVGGVLLFRRTSLLWSRFVAAVVVFAGAALPVLVSRWYWKQTHGIEPRE